MLGITYKPNTNVVEESAALSITALLVQSGIRVGIYDPMGLSEARKILKDKVEYFDSIEDCLADADLCVIATPWREFKKLQLPKLAKKMRRPTILDCWRILDGTKFRGKPRLSYSAIGIGGTAEELRSHKLPFTKHRRIESLVT